MVEEVTPDEVKERLDAGADAQIVDIRPATEYAEGHVPGAINIPMTRLPTEIGNYDWGDDIVVVCPVGESSIQAARLLQSYEGVGEDADVASMAGGYTEWTYELESDVVDVA